MSSTELFEAASISTTSSEFALWIDGRSRTCRTGSWSGPGGRGSSGVPEQFRQAARILAIEVLPVPREPTKR
jgi:hypothetical protein